MAIESKLAGNDIDECETTSVSTDLGFTIYRQADKDALNDGTNDGGRQSRRTTRQS